MYLVLQRHPPYSAHAASETLDIALGFAVMDQACALLFIDDGVYQLLATQAPSAQKNLAKHFAALPMYGIDQWFCDRDSLLARNIDTASLLPGVQIVDASYTQQLIADAVQVFSL